MTTDRLITAAGIRIPTQDASNIGQPAGTFPDGAHYRVEIASVESPACLEAVLETASRLQVPVTRVSQGSGIGMLTDAELADMVAVAAEARIELSLFARPGAGWGPSASAMAAAGPVFGASSRGSDQLAAALADIERAANAGLRSVLIADLGLLRAFARLRGRGDLPPDMIAKTSVMLPTTNPASAQVLEELGADTLNVGTDLDLRQLAEIRANTSLPLDIYIESPDNLGGFVRHHELHDMIAVAAPIYAKFGLRNAPDVYPAGSHLDSLAVSLCVERVRRARLALDRLESTLRGSTLEPRVSLAGAAGLAVPRPS